MPDAHEVTPVLQPAFGFVEHATPATQAPHVPLLQTRSGPQVVPFGTFVESMHVVEPLLHEVMPALQGAPGFEVQAFPATHMPQKPFASQTCPLPQFVPAAFGVPSTHTEAPDAHEVTPFRQAALRLVVQADPAVHGVHTPAALQTDELAHGVPAAFGASSTHVAAPD